MVLRTQETGRTTIVAQPNCSASWRSNQIMLAALSFVSLTIAVMFTLAGAWPILPFAGLELTALGAALYYVSWKLRYRHVICVEGDTLSIAKGHYHPRKQWVLSRNDVRLAITANQHPLDAPGLAVHDRNEHIEIGEFLNRDESLELMGLLRQEMRVSTSSRGGERSF